MGLQELAAVLLEPAEQIGESRPCAIEHRLFPHVTRACQGIIFKTVEQVQYYMAKAKTRTGLSVAVNILDKIYNKGRKVVEGFKKTMRIVFDNLLPRFNYRAIPTTL